MSWKETYQTWENYPELDSGLRKELDSLKGNDEALEDAFYTPLKFGTAGMRGVLGVGINRMNIYTVRQATEGLAKFMDTLDDETKQRGVAISFDSRHGSKQFAYDSARVLGAHGIPSYVFESLRPTPELSFTIRHLHTYAGIMVTASHNPKEYNGYKIYGEDGAQMPPKESDLITKYIREVKDLFDIKMADQDQLEKAGTMKIIGADIDRAYLDQVKTVTIDRDLIAEEGKKMKLIFSPLHGTGAKLGSAALREAGFEEFTMVPEQAKPDPDFSTVKKPNPEDPAAFDMAIALGKKQGADLLIAIDPDSDRLGAAVRQPSGDYQLLTGNQIAAILLDYILSAKQRKNDLPENAAVVKSIVSSEFATAIAKEYNVEMINVLTGFKFIAEKIKEFQKTGSHTFEFGFEESFGYLIKPFVRDKDAIQSTVMLAEVAAYYKKQGMNLYDALQHLFEKYGYFAEKTLSHVFAGVEGPAKIEAIMTKFRQSAPAEFASHKVTAVEDFSTSKKHFVDDGHDEEITLPKANVLKYLLDDGSWIAVRPSGTEPKIKFYIGAVDKSQDAVLAKRAAFEKAIDDFVAE